MEVKTVRNIEQTFYAKLCLGEARIQVTTKSGWQSEICRFSCETSWPGGLMLFYEGESESDKNFIPFDAIDHIKIFD